MKRPEGRPRIKRRVKKEPRTMTFSPRGRPGRPNEVILRYEELEALRLADLRRLDQQEAAKEMGISRQSFGRVLREARRRVSEALIKGNIIRIDGGDYVIANERD